MNTRAALATLLLAAPIHAAERVFDCSFTPTSQLNLDAGLSVPLAGTWIGDYDAVTNPTGTQTRPGFFGGSGNVAIPFTSIVNPAVVADGAVPSGGFTLRFDAGTGAMVVDGFSLDALGADSGDAVVNMTLTYSTFRTFSPDSLFVGVNGLTVPLPVGDVSNILVTQTGPAGGVAVPQADGTSTFSIVIPCLISIQASGMGQTLDQAIPSAFVLSGRIEELGGGVQLTATVAHAQTEPIPEGLPPLESQPVAMPTILPPGGTANLLVSGVFGAGSSTVAVDGTLVALGEPAGIAGDINGDGVVNGADLGVLLRAWGQSNPSADLNGDGTVDGQDLVVLLANWTH